MTVATGDVTVHPNTANGTKGAVQTVNNLPAGASCVVTETNAPTGSTNLTDTSYVWGTPTYAASSTVSIPEDGTATVDITNPVHQNTGSLAVTKVVTPRAGVPAAGYTGGDRTFPITYTCAIGGTTVKSGTVNVKAGGTGTVTNVPATAVCSFTENQSFVSGDFADASYAWDGTALPNPVTVTTGGTAAATVTNYFTRNLASLTLKKIVTGNGYTGTGADFSVHYDCGTPYVGTVQLKAGESKSVNVPSGVSCAVNEVAPNGSLLTGGYVWNTPSYDGLTAGYITVPAHGATVTVTNSTSIGYGQLTVAKAITANANKVDNGTTFPIVVKCDAPERGATANYDHTFNLAAGASDTTPYLPIATKCSVTESPAPTGSTSLPADGSYVWGVAPAAQNATIPASTTPASVTVTNTIGRAYGTLAIVKNVVNHTSVALDGTTYAGTWTCTHDGDADATGTWSVTGAGAAALTGDTSKILLGSSCSVTENDPAAAVPGDASYVWTKAVPGAVAITATKPHATETVTNTLDRTEGTFSISKTITGAAAGTGYAADATFPFTYSCTPAGGGSAITGTVAVPAGGSAGPDGTNIPAGSTCTVTEGTNPAPIDPYRWGSVTLSTTHAASAETQDGRSITFTTDTAGTSVNVNAVNDMHAATANVTVTKKVTGETAGYTGGTTKLFPVTLTCDGVSAGTKQVAKDGTVTFTKIPLGETCSVTEGSFTGGLKDGSYAWGTATYSTPVKVEDGGASLTVTNPITRVYGTIGVTKVLHDNGLTGVVASDKQYSGTWTCTYGSDDAVTGTWSGTGTAAGTPATLTGVPDKGILIGSSCSATESALGAPSGSDASYHWATPVVTDATVSANGATVVVTNTLERKTADLTVSKSVTGETDGFAPDHGFTGFPVAVKCYLDEPTDSVTLQANVTVDNGKTVPLIGGVPVGWTCAVNEGAFSGQLENPSYAWGTPVISIGGTAGDTVKVTDAGATYKAHIDNPITRVTGTFGITKAIASGTPDGVVNSDAQFSGTYTCVYNAGKSDAETFTGAWTRTGAGKATLKAASGQGTTFPLGTSCTATENTPDASGLVDASWTWATPQISGAVTVSNDVVTPVITVTNTPTRVYGALSVTKVYTGVDGAFAAGTNVTGTWKCSYDNQTVSGSWTLPASGGTVAIAKADGSVEGVQIPLTSDCIVTENSLSAVPLTDASFTWNTPTYSPAKTVGNASVGHAVLTASGQTVTVTNSTKRVYASFGITKKVDLGSGVSHDKLDTGLTFSGTYSCTYGTDAAVTGTWSTTEDKTWTSGDVLVGSICQVSAENTPAVPSSSDSSYQWVAPQFGDPVTVAVGHTPTITVTNTVERLKGTFSITKALAGDVEGETPGSTYGFDWKCTAKNGDVFPDAAPGDTAKIAAGGVWNAPDDIPVGSTCVVHELTPPAPTDPSYAWSTAYGVTGVGENGSTAVDGGISFVVPSGSTPVVLTATNTLTRTVGSYTVNKSATPASGSTVQPGKTITYHVTVTPGKTGFVKNVVVTDDLTNVLDNADLQSVSSITAPQGTVSVQPGNQLVWNVGTVRAGQPLVLDYTVTVHPDAFGVTLRNAITTTGEVPPDCGDAGCTTTTEHFTPAWLLTKSSDPESGTVVDQGEPITYTLTAKNTSKALVHGAIANDDLGGLLDSADLVQPLNSALTLATNGKSLAWAVPDLQPGESATVTYQVKVKADAFHVTVDNQVAPDGQGGTCPDAEKQQDGSCSTTNRVKDVDLALVKSHLPIAGDAVDSGKGDTIDYVLAVTNKGQDAATDVTVSDTLPAGLTPVAGTATGPTGWTVSFSGDKLTATFPGPFASGATANITFSALVGTLTRSGIDKPFPDIVNSACVSEKQTDSNTADNCSTDTTKVKSIAVTALAKCVNDTPLVDYSVTPFDLSGSPKIALIWWTPAGFAHRDPSIAASDKAGLLKDGAQQVDYIPVPAGWTSGQTITGTQLWPGAAVDAKGNPIAWPGWKQMSDGTWVLDPTAPFYDLRGQAVVEVRINPSTAAAEVYPPASPNCNAAPPQQTPPTGMADTGSNLAPTLGTAAALLALGSLLMLWFVRRRRRDGQPE